jgi:hypothetical protein
MRNNSIARFTATALIVAAVLLFILAIIPVIAIAVGGLGAGWGAGSRIWLVFPLAVGACSGALLLLAFGAMLLVLSRIQDNLAVWRQRQVEAAGMQAVTAPTQQEVDSAALASAAVAPDAVAASQTEGPAEEVVSAEADASRIAPGVALAGVAVAAAKVSEQESAPPVSEAESAESMAEPVIAAAGVGASQEEERGPGLGAVLAGAGVAAVTAAARDEKAEPEAGVVSMAEAVAPEVEAGAPEREAGGPGLGAVLAGAGIAAAVAAGSGSEETQPETTPIPVSAPEPEPGAPSVEITEAEAAPAVTDEGGGLGAAPAIVAAGVAAAAMREGEAEPPPEAASLEAGGEAAAIEAALPNDETLAKPARSVAWAYDEGTANVTKAAGAVKVEGIGQVYAGKLKEMGITTTAALLRAGATPKGRKELAEQSGISPKQILKWVNRVDLARIKGISEQYADLLEAAGVDTVPELAQRNAESLLQKLVETNEAKRLVRRLPTLGMVSNWIAQAKELPRVIVYK